MCSTTVTRDGVYWNPTPDSFFYTVNQSSNDVPLTKRLMLSQIAQLFDPLGLLGPVIVQAKIVMQSLWINDNEENWPISILRTNEELPAGRRKPKLFANLTYTNEIASKLFERMGSFTKLIHVVAYCQRFINSKALKVQTKGNLSINEFKKAKLCVIKLLQREAFLSELKILETSGEIAGKLTQLTLFLDWEDILRVGGRLSQFNSTYFQKHPILLPKNHRVTNLIHEQHMKLFHAGTQATLGAILNEYWIVNGRSTVKNVIRKCVICCRAKPRIPDYIMGNLPKNRTVFERAFLHTGIDYCGPFYIKERKFRNRNKVKIDAAIFVCFATKAVHIEIVSDLITEALLACLKRCFARRGKSSDLYSDNATIFQGAQREIS